MLIKVVSLRKSDGLQESGGVLQIASLFDWKDIFEGTK